MLKLDLVTVIGTVVNLLILYFVLKKFLFKRVDGIIEKRQQEVQDRLSEADAAKQEAAKQQAQIDALAQKNREEQAQAMKEAAAKADAQYESIVSAANVKAKQIKDDAQEATRKEHDEMIRQAEKEVASMAIEAADRISAKQVSPQVDSNLYDQFIRETGEQK